MPSTKIFGASSPPVSENLNVRTPAAVWWMLLLVSAAFLATVHDPLVSTYVGYVSPTSSSPDLMADAVASGSTVRRTAFLAVGALGGFLLLRGRVPRRPTSTGVLAVALYAWMMLTFVWSDNRQLTATRLVLATCIIVAAVAVAQRADGRNLAAYLIVQNGAILLVGLAAELVAGTFAPLASGYRFAGTLHPNAQAVNDVLLLLAAVHQRRHTAGAKRGFLAAVVVIGAVALLATRSRTALGAALVAYGYLAFPSETLPRGGASERPARLLYVWCLLALGATAAYVQQVLPFLAQAASLGRSDPNAEDLGALTGRVPLWQILLDYARARPVTGYGYDGFWYPRRGAIVGEAVGWPVQHAHSSYIDILLSGGVPAVVLLVLVLGSAIKRARALARKYSWAPLCGAIILFGAIQGFLETSLLAPEVLLFPLCWSIAAVSGNRAQAWRLPVEHPDRTRPRHRAIPKVLGCREPVSGSLPRGSKSVC